MFADEFTRILWEDTTKIGIAMKREMGYYRVVVLYSPKGNIRGQYKDNVNRRR